MTTRNGLIAKIHVARRDLGLDEATYRQALMTAVGKASLKAMDLRELERVVAQFEDRGFKVRRTRRDVPQDPRPLASKIRALWIALADLGAVKNRSERAINSFVEKMTSGEINGPRVSAMQFATDHQLWWVVEQLKKWRERAGIKAAADEAASLDGFTGEQLLEICRKYDAPSGYAAMELERRGWQYEGSYYSGRWFKEVSNAT